MDFINVMSPRQARAARAVLRLSVQALAAESGVSGSSIRRIEDEGRDVTIDLTARLQAHFIERGIRFRFAPGEAGVAWEVK